MLNRLFLSFVTLLMVGGAVWLSVPEETMQRLSEVSPQELSELMPAAGGEGADPAMASHKALYDFRTVAVESGSGVSGVTGQMFYEQADVCDAWTTDHRFTTEYQYPERKSVMNTSRYVAWEAKDGSDFHFNSERQEDGVNVEQLRGSVTRGGDGAAVAEYSRPEELSFDLPSGYFLPTRHTVEIIRRAQQGERFFSAVMFDGTDADGPVEVNAFIGKPATAEEIRALTPAGKEVAADLLAPAAWHVRMAVFPLEEDRENMTPSYEMDMLLHANGVVSHALVDYKSFKVEQRLQALESLPPQTCEE